MTKFTDEELIEILREILSRNETTIKEGMAIIAVAEKAGLSLWKKKDAKDIVLPKLLMSMM